MFLLLSTTPGLSLSDTGGCHSAHQNSRYCGDCPQQYGRGGGGAALSVEARPSGGKNLYGASWAPRQRDKCGVTTVKPEPLFKPIAKSHLHSHSSVHTIARQSNLDGALEPLKSAEQLFLLTALSLLCFCYLTPLSPTPNSSICIIYYLTWMLGM